MKKRLSALLALMLAFCMLFTACSPATGLKGEMDEDAAAPTETETEPAEAPTEPAETATESAPETDSAVSVDGAVLETDGIALATDGAGATAKAAVYYQNEWHYYDTFAQAWATANAWNEENCKFMLLADWIADENGSFDDHGGYGDDGWGFYKGMLNPKDRGDDGGDEDSWLIVDLNGYTIDKNLYSAGESHDWANPVKNNRKENGRIFYLDSYDSNFNMTIENGTLRGANTEDAGGAIWVDDEDVNLCLENLTITDNCAEDDGGAIWVDICDSLCLTDVNIQYNYCTNDSTAVGAAVLDDGDFYLYGTVNINLNYGKAEQNEEASQNNLILGDWLESAGVTAESSIHLSDVTTSFGASEDDSKPGHFRRLTPTSESSEPENSVPFTKEAFYLDYELTSRGYYEVYYLNTAWYPSIQNHYHWVIMCN